MATDCDDVADDEMCSDGGSAIDDPIAPVEPLTPIELSCDEEGNLDGTGPFEIVVDGRWLGSVQYGTRPELAIAGDGTIFTAGTIDDVHIGALRVVDGELQPFGIELGNRDELIIAGSDLITTKSDHAETTIVTTNLETDEQLTVAREGCEVTYFSAGGDAFYWAGWCHDQIDELVSYSVWRSPREPGESVMLGQFESISRHTFVAVNDDLFFHGLVNGRDKLIRLADGGISRTEVDVDWIAGVLRSDGQDLFFVDSFSGVVRIDPTTFERETLFDTDENVPLDLVATEQHLYWLTEPVRAEPLPDTVTPIVKLWRGLKDGSGTAEQLGTVEAFTGPLAEHDGELYFLAWCRAPRPSGLPVPRQSHIVKITN